MLSHKLSRQNNVNDHFVRIMALALNFVAYIFICLFCHILINIHIKSLGEIIIREFWEFVAVAYVCISIVIAIVSYFFDFTLSVLSSILFGAVCGLLTPFLVAIIQFFPWAGFILFLGFIGLIIRMISFFSDDK